MGDCRNRHFAKPDSVLYDFGGEGTTDDSNRRWFVGDKTIIGSSAFITKSKIGVEVGGATPILAQRDTGEVEDKGVSTLLLGSETMLLRTLKLVVCGAVAPQQRASPKITSDDFEISISLTL